MFDREDDQVEDDDMDFIDNDDLGQNVNFEAPESGYRDEDSDMQNININQIPGEISTIRYGYQLSYKICKIFIDLP